MEEDKVQKEVERKENNKGAILKLPDHILQDLDEDLVRVYRGGELVPAKIRRPAQFKKQLDLLEQYKAIHLSSTSSK